jgi:hypothetical protein
VLGTDTVLRFREVLGERLMATRLSKARRRSVLNQPELNIALFAFLLNFVWEMLQSPFFRGIAQMRHWDAVLICTQATLGDAGIALAAFWAVAWRSGGRDWPLRPSAAQVAGFAAVGIIVTIAFELLATQVWGLWSYSDEMPVIQILEVGLIPLLQWMVLPPLIVWFVHRQLTRRCQRMALTPHANPLDRMTVVRMMGGANCFKHNGAELRCDCVRLRAVR